MSDEMSAQPVPPPPQPPAPPAPIVKPATEPSTEFHIGDEFGTAKRNLPPTGIVLICIAAVAVIVGIFAFKERPKPQGAGSINFVTAAEVPGQNMILAAITMTLRNTADQDPARAAHHRRRQDLRGQIRFSRGSRPLLPGFPGFEREFRAGNFSRNQAAGRSRTERNHHRQFQGHKGGLRSAQGADGQYPTL
jgi:hypothetical protein